MPKISNIFTSQTSSRLLSSQTTAAVQQEFQKLHSLFRQNQTETAKTHLKNLVQSHKVSQLYTEFSISSPSYSNSIFSTSELYYLLKKDGIFLRWLRLIYFLSGLCNAGRMDEASNVLEEMDAHGIVPDAFTYSIIFDGFSKSGNIDALLELFEEIDRKGIEINQYTCGVFLNGLCQAG
ncbi:hypothetical protein LIER_26045 [Lithospermum erythrorhizon]|uniref:Pentatricopeptide repeat-containing protein n=1 Tax=Lithospermum erythrorhizon TaxID=34254 RepID=A0AAV3R923_LITER